MECINFAWKWHFQGIFFISLSFNRFVQSVISVDCLYQFISLKNLDHPAITYLLAFIFHQLMMVDFHQLFPSLTINVHIVTFTFNYIDLESYPPSIILTFNYINLQRHQPQGFFRVFWEMAFFVCLGIFHRQKSNFGKITLCSYSIYIDVIVCFFILFITTLRTSNRFCPSFLDRAFVSYISASVSGLSFDVEVKFEDIKGVIRSQISPSMLFVCLFWYRN